MEGSPSAGMLVFKGPSVEIYNNNVEKSESLNTNVTFKNKITIFKTIRNVNDSPFIRKHKSVARACFFLARVRAMVRI